MRINQRLAVIIISLFSVMYVTTVFAVDQSNPVQLLQYIADQMIAGLKQNKATLKTKPQIVYNLANKYVVPYADLTFMSKQVLPARTWNSATASQRAQFQKEFTRTLIRTYASALTSYEDQTVRFFPVRGNISKASTITVDSEINNPQGSPIRVNYRLVRRGAAWRLFDMSVEGVSLIDSFRAQFADILATGNMADLLKQMSNHNTSR